jgi:hypothetical protein
LDFSGAGAVESAARHRRRYRASTRRQSERIDQPVGDIVHAHGAVVDLAVLGAALFCGEYLEMLAGGELGIERAGLLDRNDAVVLAVEPTAARMAAPEMTRVLAGFDG